MPWISGTKEGSKIKIRVQPRSSRSTIGAIHDDRLKVYVTPPPLDEMANKECVRLLAKTLRIPKSDIKITTGKTGRNKTILIFGTDPDFITKMLIDKASN